MLAIAHTTPVDRDACERLAALGVTLFEIDVRLRGSDVVASHYLPLLPRLEVVQRHNRRLRLGRPWAVDLPLHHIADVVPPQCRILLDCKDDTGAPAQRLTTRLLDSVGDTGRYVVASKNWPALRLLTDAGVETWVSVATPRALRTALSSDVPCRTVTARHTLLDADVVRVLRRRYGRVMAWTVNDPARAQRLALMGVDGVTSDDPEVLHIVARRK